MAKRLTKIQKEEIIQSFTEGKTIEALSQKFSCTKLTIIRNLKQNIGESRYKELIEKNKNIKEIHQKKLNEGFEDLNYEFSNREYSDIQTSNEEQNELDYFPESSFLEITPIEHKIENSDRKELSSIPISEVDFPQIVYMVVDKKTELEVKLLNDFPEWSFLPIDDLNRKTIEIFFDIKIAKRVCNKEQKVIKVPNTNVFKIVAPLLLSRGISRIVSAEKLISF